MAHANWGGPGAGFPGEPQGFMRTAPEMEAQQDPAWHGQPPVTRHDPGMSPHVQSPQVQSPQAHAPQQDPYAAVRPTSTASYGAPMRPAAQPATQPVQQTPHYAQGAPMRPIEPAHSPMRAAPAQERPAPQPAPQDSYYAAPPSPAPEGRREKGGGFVALAGAASSVALIVGLAVWGYNLAMRDVTDVPVVAALDGPMRVQPDAPGGTAADHQGLAVNNVAADGTAEGPSDTLVLAPAVAELDAGDLPTAANPEFRAATAESGEMPAQLGTAPLDASLSDDEARLVVEDLVDQIIGEAAPLSEDTAARIGDTEPRFIAPSIPGVAESPRPRPRPGTLVTRTASNPATEPLLADPGASATQSGAPEVDAASIPVGTRLVQLGAYDSVNVARAEWEKLSSRFPDNMEGKSRVIEQAQSGGKVFYRLRAMGFADLTDARRFCSALMSGQAACIPVVTR